MLLQLTVDLIAFFRSQMSDRTFYQFQIGIDRFPADLTDFLFLVKTIYIFISTEFQINII